MILNFRWVKPEDRRADIHPLAVVDTDEPIMECAGCGLPVPMEVNGNIYCCAACEDKAFEVALIDNAIAEAIAADDIFGQMFPQVAMLPDCDPFVECSCNH